MALQFLWWIAAAILVGVEMMTGTFCLLGVALAGVAGGAVAAMGYDIGWRWGAAAVAVSYTHRDVYKRQPSGRARTLPVTRMQNSLRRVSASLNASGRSGSHTT